MNIQKEPSNHTLQMGDTEGMVCELHLSKAFFFFKKMLGIKLQKMFYYYFCHSSESVTQHLEIILIVLADRICALERNIMK